MPFKGLIRPFKGLIRSFKGLIRPLKGLIRPRALYCKTAAAVLHFGCPLRALYKALKGPYKALAMLACNVRAAQTNNLTTPT